MEAMDADGQVHRTETEHRLQHVSRRRDQDQGPRRLFQPVKAADLLRRHARVRRPCRHCAAATLPASLSSSSPSKTEDGRASCLSSPRTVQDRSRKYVPLHIDDIGLVDVPYRCLGRRGDKGIKGEANLDAADSFLRWPPGNSMASETSLCLGGKIIPRGGLTADLAASRDGHARSFCLVRLMGFGLTRFDRCIGPVDLDIHHSFHLSQLLNHKWLDSYQPTPIAGGILEQTTATAWAGPSPYRSHGRRAAAWLWQPRPIARAADHGPQKNQPAPMAGQDRQKVGTRIKSAIRCRRLRGWRNEKKVADTIATAV
jgi:hypothetical protein